MSKSFESLGDHWRRIRAGKRLPPLRTLKEMAEEFGVSPGTLKNLIHERNGPAPKLKHTTTTVRGTWYEPKALRAWWATVQKK